MLWHAKYFVSHIHNSPCHALIFLSYSYYFLLYSRVPLLCIEFPVSGAFVSLYPVLFYRYPLNHTISWVWCSQFFLRPSQFPLSHPCNLIRKILKMSFLFFLWFHQCLLLSYSIMIEFRVYNEWLFFRLSPGSKWCNLLVRLVSGCLVDWYAWLWFKSLSRQYLLILSIKKEVSVDNRGVYWFIIYQRHLQPKTQTSGRGK